MLVITRRIGEGIMVTDDIEITIERIRNKQVKISIEAPRNIQVDRKEIYEAKKISSIAKINKI